VRATRLVPLLLVLMLATASCGGEGSVFETGSTTSAPATQDLVDAQARDAAEMIVADLGPEPGMLAVGYALDRGFTAGQMADAGLEGTLMTDGTIIGGEPELGLQGIFSDLPQTGGSATGGGSRITPALERLADDPDPAEPNPYEVQITKDQWVAGLQAEADLVFSGLAAPSAPSSGGSTTTTTEPDGHERATIMIGLIVELSDLGYSAEQIIVGIALGEVHVVVVATGMGPTGCWLLRSETDGGVIRPTGPALSSLRRTDECRQAVDRLAPPETDSTTTTSSSTTTTTSAAAEDADGIANGIYTGSVAVTGDMSAPVYELSDTLAELAVTDDGVQATVEFTARVSVRVRGMDPVCIATTRRTYFGQGSPAVDVELPMEPQLQEIISLEGPECGVVEGWWSTTVEQDLLDEFAEEVGFSLVGSFSNGTFEGTIAGVLGVSASLGG